MKNFTIGLKLLFVIVGMVSMTIPVTAQEWDNINPLDELPTEAPWRSRDDVLDFSSIVADPAVEDNNLLLLDDFSGIERRGSYRYDWLLQEALEVPPEEVNEKTGITVVFRAKPSSQAIENPESAVWMYISVRSSGPNAFMTDLRWTKDTLAVLGFDHFFPGGESIIHAMPNDTSWHVFRVTALGQEVNVYLDENPNPVISGKTYGTDKGADHLRIGKQDRGSPYGGEFDYFLILEGAIYAPGEGPAIPEDLVGGSPSFIGTAIENTVSGITCYPNPVKESMTVSFMQDVPGVTTIEIYDMLGQKIATPFVGNLSGESQQININTSNLIPQIYILKINEELTRFIKE